MPNLAQALPLHKLTEADATKMLTYNTRFGEVQLREDRLIAFPEGLFGFGHCTVFGLTKLPNVDESPILLLQCVNEPEVAFMVADPVLLGITIKPADRQQALSDTKMAAPSTQFMVILTLYDHGEGYYVTANVRAPLLLDANTRTAKQYILPNKEYSTQAKI